MAMDIIGPIAHVVDDLEDGKELCGEVAGARVSIPLIQLSQHHAHLDPHVGEVVLRIKKYFIEVLTTGSGSYLDMPF